MDLEVKLFSKRSHETGKEQRLKGITLLSKVVMFLCFCDRQIHSWTAKTVKPEPDLEKAWYYFSSPLKNHVVGHLQRWPPTMPPTLNACVPPLAKRKSISSPLESGWASGPAVANRMQWKGPRVTSGLRPYNFHFCASLEVSCSVKKLG